jgi:hypothetical protein
MCDTDYYTQGWGFLKDPQQRKKLDEITKEIIKRSQHASRMVSTQTTNQLHGFFILIFGFSS